MKYELPELPYAFDALEPYIDRATMETHYTKHHQAYADKLNAALEKHPELHEKDLETLLKNITELPEDIRQDVRNHGGGYYNHSLFWPMMSKKGGGEPEGGFAQALAQTFGGFEHFKEKFSQAALKQFGSGWAWLVLGAGGELEIISTPNQDVPPSGKHPIILLDVWEHAYYLKYKNRRADYIESWWNVVNWEEADRRFNGAR